MSIYSNPAADNLPRLGRTIKHHVDGRDGAADIFVHIDTMTGASVVLDLSESTIHGEPVGVSFTPAQAIGLAHLLMDRADAARAEQDIEHNDKPLRAPADSDDAGIAEMGSVIGSSGEAAIVWTYDSRVVIQIDDGVDAVDAHLDIAAAEKHVEQVQRAVAEARRIADRRPRALRDIEPLSIGGGAQHA